VLHEFSSIAGVLEEHYRHRPQRQEHRPADVWRGPEADAAAPTGPGEVRAGAIETGHDIDIMNPDLVICTLDSGTKIAMELTVENGKGYVPATQNGRRTRRSA